MFQLAPHSCAALGWGPCLGMGYCSKPFFCKVCISQKRIPKTVRRGTNTNLGAKQNPQDVIARSDSRACPERSRRTAIQQSGSTPSGHGFFGRVSGPRSFHSLAMTILSFSYRLAPARKFFRLMQSSPCGERLLATHRFLNRFFCRIQGGGGHHIGHALRVGSGSRWGSFFFFFCSLL